MSSPTERWARNCFAAGLKAGDSPEAWNVSRPDIISAVHRDYFQAGADLVLTNTFGMQRPSIAVAST